PALPLRLVRGMNSDSNNPAGGTACLDADRGEPAAFWNSTVLPLLEQIAERHLRGERSSITLEPADLVQEAYLRLSGLAMPLKDRQHFVSLVSTALRRVLADHARRKQAAKRGDSPMRITLRSRDADREQQDAVQLLELDSLLHDLARADERKAR